MKYDFYATGMTGAVTTKLYASMKEGFYSMDNENLDASEVIPTGKVMFVYSDEMRSNGRKPFVSQKVFHRQFQEF